MTHPGATVARVSAVSAALSSLLAATAGPPVCDSPASLPPVTPP